MPEQLIECVGCWFSGQRVKAARIVDPEESSGSEEHATLGRGQRLHLARDGRPIRRRPQMTALPTGRELPDAGPEVVVEQTLVHVQ